MCHLSLFSVTSKGDSTEQISQTSLTLLAFPAICSRHLLKAGKYSPSGVFAKGICINFGQESEC